VPIWRYMDFTKFVSMLESSSLYFARADLLGDPFEGSYSRGNERLRPEIHKEIYKDLPVEALTNLVSGQANFAKWFRSWVFINCWHMNESESAGMWKLYAKTNEAVAVRSSFLRLSNGLDKKAYVGMVDYIDFDRDWLPEGNSLYPYVHKRLSFAHEREVRAVIIHELPIKDNVLDWTAVPPIDGMEEKINLFELIESVYVAPTSPNWFKLLVEQVCRRYALTVKVVRSSLDEEPFF